MLFPKDYDFKETLDDESISKFLFPHGLCHQLTNFSMDKEYYGGKHLLIPNDYSDLYITISDPYRQTYSSINTISQVGDQLEYRKGQLAYYEISLEVVNSYAPAKTDTCNNRNDYFDCVERETLNIFKEVTYIYSYINFILVVSTFFIIGLLLLIVFISASTSNNMLLGLKYGHW